MKCYIEKVTNMNIKLLKTNIKNLLLEEANSNKSVVLIEKLKEINKKIEEKISKFSFINLKQMKLCLKIVKDSKYEISFCLMIKYKNNQIEFIDLHSGKTIVSILKLSNNLSNNVINDDDYEIFLDEKEELINLFISESMNLHGYIVFGSRKQKEKKCYDSYTIYETGLTKDGWGPLLYDLALEYSTMLSNGLTPDRNVVSPSAYRIWKNYFENRPDVAKLQLDIDDEQDYVEEHLDNLRNDSESGEDYKNKEKMYGFEDGKLKQLTPYDDNDDCRMESVLDYFYYSDLHKWPQSPLSKMYKKEPNIINKLKSAKLLYEKI
jgi:hypothetical protein